MGLQSLIQSRRVNNNSMNKTGTTGSIAGRIVKMLIYGKEGKSETDIKSTEQRKQRTTSPSKEKNKKENKTIQNAEEMKFKNKLRN